MVAQDVACVWTCATCRAARGPTVVDTPPGRRLELAERKCALFLGVDHYGKSMTERSAHLAMRNKLR